MQSTIFLTAAFLVGGFFLFYVAIVNAASVGEIVITEFMANPSAVDDNKGEWMEVQNTTQSSIDLNGWKVDDHTIESSVNIAAGESAVLCVNSDASLNGGVACAYDLTNVFLVSGDTITLQDDSDVIIHSITYTSDDVSEGKSTNVAVGPVFTVEEANNYGDGDYGTPAGNKVTISSHSYATIQSAINDANPGDTIIVSDGTYTYTSEGSPAPSGLIKVTKGVTIKAAEGTRPIIDGTGADGVFKIHPAALDNGNTVIIEGFEIIGDPSTGIAMTMQGCFDVTPAQVIIRDNWFHGMIGAIDFWGATAFLPSGWTSGVINTEITGNKFYDMVAAGGNQGFGIIIESPLGWATADNNYAVKIEDNEFSNLPSDGANYGTGIGILDMGGTLIDANVLISGNTFADDVPIGVYFNNVDAITTKVVSNNFDNNPVAAILATGTINHGSIDAENNWWGAATGPSTASISGDVDFAPYHTDFGMTTLSTSYSVCANGCNFTSIQNAIDAASAGNTINVAAGTYTEIVVINKPLTLLGATYDVNKNGYTVPTEYAWDDTVESIINHPSPGTGHSAVAIVDIVDVSNVTFEGFVVQELNAVGNVDDSLVRVRAQTQEVSNIIVRNNIIGPFTNTTEQDGTHGRMGLYIVNNPYSNLYGVVNSTFSGNKIFDTKGNGNNVFIWSSYYSYGAAGPASMSGTVIEDNEIYGSHRTGIETAGGFSNLTIKNNKIYGNGGLFEADSENLKYGHGILLVRGSSDASTVPAGFGPENLTIQGNEIYDNQKSGIYMGPINKDYIINDNKIYDNGMDGIRVDLESHFKNPDFEDIDRVEFFGKSENIIANNNSIYNNSGYGVQVIGTPTNGFILDAIDNYWGADFPTFATIVSENVNYDPWYFDPDFTQSSTQIADIFQGIASTLSGNGIASNIGDVTASNFTSFSGLYFKKSIDGSEMGKITFNSSLDLSSDETQTFLQDLGGRMDANPGIIGLDFRETAEDLSLKGISAEIKFYGMDDLGFGDESTVEEINAKLIARDDEGSIIDKSGLITPESASYVGACGEEDEECYVFTISVEHFTTYEVDVTPPADATFSADKTATTNSNVNVAISFPADAVIKQYKIDEGEYIDYTGTVAMTVNGTVSAKSSDSANNWSNETSYEVTNIDKTSLAPTSLTAGSTTTNSLVLSWTNNEANGSYYIIKRSESEITEDNFDAATTLGGAPTPVDGNQGYVAKNLSSDTTYYFAIKLVDTLDNTSDISTTSEKTSTPTAVSTDTTAPTAITDLALQAGSPATSQIKLTWKATGDDGTSGFASKYIIKRSTSEITAENFDADTATTIFNTLSPKSVGSDETFTVTGLTAGTTYYFAIKAQDEVPNDSAISNVENLATENNLPSISEIDTTEEFNDATVAITITGTNFIDGDNTLRFSNSDNTFEIAGTYVSTTNLTASIPVGAPVGVYSLKISNSNGISAALLLAYIVVEAPTPLPTVSDIIPANIGDNDSDVSLTIYGDNFTDATAVKLNTGLTLTSLVIISDTEITATIPGTIVVGTYDIKVTTAGGTNTISSVKLNVKAPITITSSSVEQTTDKPIDLSTTNTIPVQITMQSDETIVNTDTVATIEVVIPPATEIKKDDGTAYTGNINPPQIIKTTDEMKVTAGEDAIVITMGNPDEKISFSNDFVTTVTLESTNTTAPLIWYYNLSTGLEIAGNDGVKDGVNYVKGGTVLNTVNNGGVYTYTIGLLLDHMSSYVAGVNPSISSLSSSSATTGTVITITGTNFSTSATVKFGTTIATVSSLTTTSISVTVPSISVSSYNIVITNTDGLASNGQAFNVTPTPAPAPVIITDSGSVVILQVPKYEKVIINNDADESKTNTVKLTISATKMISGYAPLKMRISNIKSLIGSEWIEYKEEYNWELLSGIGTRTVYVQLRNNAGTGSLISDSIEVVGLESIAPKIIENKISKPGEEILPRVLGAQIYAQGTLIRCTDKKIYVVEDETLRHIVSLEELQNSYAGVPIIDVIDSVIENYPAIAGVKMYGVGQLLRCTDKKIYVITKMGKHHITSLEELSRDYFQKEIHDISDSLMSQY